jgi:3-mercaptopyruvate sulfurtransferase SseA
MRLNLIPRMAAALFVGMLVSGIAQAADTPAALAGTKLVTADEVAKAQSAGAVVIDSRVASEYAEGHIKGAVNVPYPLNQRNENVIEQSYLDFVATTGI